MRKFWFAYLAKALVVFPGGFGTMDEMFELLTLVQTHKLTSKLTVIIYGSDYWRSVINLDLLAAAGAHRAKDLALFQFADTPEQAFALLQAGLTQHVDYDDPHEAHEDAAHENAPPASPAPDAQRLLGPDLNKNPPLNVAQVTSAQNLHHILQETSMSKEANIAAQKKMGEIVNSYQFDKLSEVMAPDVKDHDPADDQGPRPPGLRRLVHPVPLRLPRLQDLARPHLVADDNED